MPRGISSNANTYSYDSFGKPTGTTGTFTNRFQYAGREFDPETEIYYYRARYYDTATGRFIGEDPQRLEAGVNFYVYALENPVIFKDPFGLDTSVEGPSGNEPAGHLSINVGDQTAPILRSASEWMGMGWKEWFIRTQVLGMIFTRDITCTPPRPKTPWLRPIWTA